MSKMKAKVDSLKDYNESLEWAKAVDTHQDLLVLQRLEALNTQNADETGNYIF